MTTQTLRCLPDTYVRSLDERRIQLERRVERHSTAVRAGSGHDPSRGRELDAARSLLAQVRAELARLAGEDADGR